MTSSKRSPRKILFNSYTPEYAWLSNFAPVDFIGEYKFPTVEHAYQAAKSTDPDEWRLIAAAPSPKVAKALGYRIKHPRPNWDMIKVKIMEKALRAKFEDPALREKLVATGDSELVHLSPWDNWWGIDETGYGLNILGRLLMQIRDEVRAEGE